MLNLPLKISSEDGADYEIDVWEPTIARLDELWERYSSYKVIFNDTVTSSKMMFTTAIMAPTTVVLVVRKEGQEVGIVYGTDVRPTLSCDVHYFFWDKKTNGRQKVILHAMRWAFDELRVHRINTAVPVFAYAALHRVYRLGLCIEGRRRHGILSQGKWIDMLMFSLLENELTPEALERGYVERTKEEQVWYDLLNKDELLMKHILHRRS